MAPIYDTALYETETLIARKPRNRYLTSIKPIHWQLRSIIGVSESGTVYYPAGPTNQHLQELNPTTKKSETVAYLEFSPRCLVATKGWVCCGGELGEFVAIRVSKQGDSATADTHDDHDGDGQYSRGRGHDGSNQHEDDDNDDNDNDNVNDNVNDDEEYDDFDTHMCDAPLVTVPPRMTARSGRFGKERVNCVTVWTPSSFVPLCPGAYTFPVAALSNNDKTVTLVNLETAMVLDEMEYPDCVNRAVLSPDGGILASISDDPFLYVHERVESQDNNNTVLWRSTATSSASASESSQSQSQTSGRHEGEKVYEWRLLAKHHLPGQRKEDVSVHRGSFAACFSNTGRYLAIGTQYGIITVYDTTRLADPETCMMACFSSSSPNTDAGAVREMTFCPGPYDLLAWSEDYGAAGVADIRDGFVSRQILSLTAYASYAQFPVRSTIGMNDELEERRQQRRQALGSGSDMDQVQRIRDAFDRYHSPGASDESQLRQLLEPLQQDRQRQQRRELRDGPRDLDRERIQTYLGRRSAILRSRPSRIPAAAAAGTASGDSGAADNSRTSSSETRPRERIDVDAAVNDILGTFRSFRSRDLGDAELRLLGSGSFGLLQAARRVAGSGAIPTVENEESSTSDGGGGSGGGGGGGGGGSEVELYGSLFGARAEMTRRRIHRMQQLQLQPMFPWDPSPLQQQAAASNNDSSARDDGGGGTHTPDPQPRRTNGFVRNAQRRARERQLLLENAALESTADSPEVQLLQSGLLSWDSSGSGVTARRAGDASGEPPKDGFTAGMSWSDDGTTLFVGTQEAIFEFRVDQKARMFHPSRTMR